MKTDHSPSPQSPGPHEASHVERSAVCGAALAALTLWAAAPASAVDWITVDAAVGRKGSDQPGEVHKYAFPRSDLTVTVDGVLVKPALALGGWVAFMPEGTGAMFMGDLVL